MDCRRRPAAVLRAVAVKTVPVDPEVWVIDDVSFPKDGKMSVGVARQWCGALGKQSNCQVAVSLHAASDTASVPISWRLFVPQQWQDDTARRSRAGIPEEVGHGEKWRLALDLIDEAVSWGLAPQVIVADAGYGQNNAFRQALTDRGLDFVVAVRADESAHPYDAVPTAPAWSGNGRKPAARYRTKALSLKGLAAESGRKAYRQATWRKGSQGPMRSRFRVQSVRPAGVAARTHAMAQAGGSSAWDGVLPALALLSEWPTGQKTLTDYWLTNLPADTPLRYLVRLADALADRARLPRDETRPGPGPLRRPHLAWLAPPRRPGHRSSRLPHPPPPRPKSPSAGLTFYQVLDTLQDHIRAWTGTCPTCHRDVQRPAAPSAQPRLSEVRSTVPTWQPGSV